MKKTIGIIGGMGPLATADLFTKIIVNTKATKDSDHCHVIIDNVPTIPNRGDAILNIGPSPFADLKQSAMRLKNAGADFFIMPCNTAHYWFDELVNETGLPGLSIVEATAQYLLDHNIKKIGLLATSGTIKGKVYDKVLNKYGIEAIVPDDQGQNEVMRLIYDCIKADKKPGDLSLLNSLLAKMEQSGSQACILACTELPILFKEYLPDYNAIDATLILARAAIKEAGCKIKDI